MQRHSIVHFAMKIQKPLLLLPFLASLAASAQPVHCSPGFQDSACQGVLLNPPQPAPTCTTAAGWITTSAAVWQGSRWSVPSCNYFAPPTCSSNFTMTTAPAWNGASWSMPVCVPNTPPSCPTGQSWNGSACVANPPTLSLPNGATIYDDVSPYYDPWATVTLSSNGSASGTGNVPSGGIGSYSVDPGISKWAANSPSTNGSTVEVIASLVGGNAVPSGSALGTWINLGSTQSWTISYFHGNGCDNLQSAVIQFQFRMATTHAAIGTSSVSLQANCDTSLGG